ncbi:formate dehydrogenase H alph subunit (formate-hydrogen-lyase-linked selenocysteine-containing polypeptide) [Escherichia coli]|uniref:Formate dehydrogenase H alph subunit (Formate-hydrogen-lyase-linked selenocysteine-containing polypeptide) n=1 Tax=Escherichia coli TaxID=562 RepID=A0A377B724_ECOLX|nr:formate dehydrogenase H alph subunit (formate-hydrogen-lyase-linked selenocysteine-containing polypeptide) [Escherichia coli]
MKKVVTVCPYCASGCKINLVVDNRKIVRAEGSAGENQPGYPVSEGLLWLGLH